MQANPTATYALIVAGLVHQVFAGADMLQWNEAQVTVADITAVNPAPQPGWTAAEANGAWTFTAPSPPPPATLAQQAAAALAAGLTITLSGSLTLSATLFPTDGPTQSKLAALVTTLNATGAFPGGATSYPMKDAAGEWHNFSVSQYKSVAAAISAYVADLDLIIDGNPLNAATLPANSVSLAV